MPRRVGGTVETAALRHRSFIPVTIDAVRELDGIEMIRVTYFVLTSDAPAAVWEIELPPLARLHGVGALGIAGVVYSAMRESDEIGFESVEFDLFEGPADIAAIFSLEHGESPFTVQVEDVWMPVAWFRDVGTWVSPAGRTPSRAPERGDVYRVALALFQDAYRYTAGEIDLERLVSLETGDQVFASPVESEAIRAWSQDQIDQTRAAFPDKAVKLRYREATVA